MRDSNWSTIKPEGCLSADGTSWTGSVRWGNPDKVAVVFQGGGVSVNSVMDATPEKFFISRINVQDLARTKGLFSADSENPFSNWTLLYIPYTSGDFHTGTSRNVIRDSDGKEKIIYHEGYLNYRKFMDTVVPQLKKKPEQLLITGFSAGGFATAMLSDDVISNYFPDVDNITCCIDSSLIVFEGWKEIAVNFWKSPKSISDFIVSDNITLDSIRHIALNYPNCKILFCCSPMDCALTSYTVYLRTNDWPESPGQYGILFKESLKKFCDEFVSIRNTGLFIFNEYDKDSVLTDLPSAGIKGADGLTAHTIEMTDYFFKYKQEGKSVAEWIIDTVNTGKSGNIGLELLN